MKSLFKLIFLFFIMIFAFCTHSQNNLSFNNPPVNYIQNDYQKVAFVSNTLQSGEIFSNSEDNDNNSTFNRTSASLNNLNKINLKQNIAQSNWESIHNLSTDRRSTGFIRAP